MSGSDPTAPSEHRRSSARLIAAPVLAAAAVCLVLLALSWPTLTARPRQLPVAVTGPAEMVKLVSTAVERSAPDGIDVLPVGDRAAAVDAIRTRDAIGALVLQPGRVEVLTASAAGAAQTQVMQQIAGALSSPPAGRAPAAGAPTVTRTDVVPLSADDPTGNRLMAAVLPLALGGVLGGALLGTVLRRPAQLLVGLIGYALVAGFGLAAILQFWYGALAGSYPITAVAMAGTLLAVASIVVGLRRLLGVPGIGVAAALFVLGAVPISGATVPREFLPQGWSDLGQLSPQGAAVTLLRDLSYFPDASTAVNWWVLAGWIALGLLLTGLPFRRPQRLGVHAESTASTAAAR